MSDFMECAACAAKSGSPQLCAACLHNRAELAKVRAKSEERRKALESLKMGDLPRGMWGPFCPWCRKYQPWGDGPQEHSEDCGLVMALKEYA